jgi:hypothetical protein
VTDTADNKLFINKLQSSYSSIHVHIGRSDTGVAQAEDIRQLQQKCKQLEILHQNRRASLLQPEAMSGRHHRYTNANYHNTDQETTALAFQTGMA